MRLRHIEILFAIRKTGSVSAAAAALSITQSAASKILKHAEQRLGFALFRRAHGRIYPTDEAELLLLDVEKVFAALDRTRDTARILRERLDMRLRVVCLPSLGFSVVPRAVQMFQKLHPRTTIEIAARHTQEMMDALLAQEFDIGISFGPEKLEHTVIGIDAALITLGELVYIDHPTSPAVATTGPVKLSQLDEGRLIGLNSSHYLGTALSNALERQGVTRVPSIQVQTYYFARALVAAGTGCAVVDEFTANAASADVAVRAIDPPIRFGVYAYSRSQNSPTDRTLEFLDCLRTVCRDNPHAPVPVAQRPVRRQSTR
jgi:DNA-binding transcriptional LysR family regulator